MWLIAEPLGSCILPVGVPAKGMDRSIFINCLLSTSYKTLHYNCLTPALHLFFLYNLAMETTIDTSYIQTLKEIKERIYEARYRAITTVNKELIKLYWGIGEIICKKQEREAWGKSTVERLAKDLQVEFEGIRGFSAQNLWNMQHYYLAYKSTEILQTLSREIWWSHNIEVLNRCKDDLEREFYLRMTAKYGWSVRTLQE